MQDTPRFAVARVEGKCMFPLLDEGEQVILSGNLPPRVGDIALVRAPRGTYLHRIYALYSIGGSNWVVHGGERGALLRARRGDVEAVRRVDLPLRRRLFPLPHRLASLMDWLGLPPIQKMLRPLTLPYKIRHLLIREAAC